MDLLGLTHNMQEGTLWLLFMIALMKLLCWFADFRVRVMSVFVHVRVFLAASMGPTKKKERHDLDSQLEQSATKIEYIYCVHYGDNACFSPSFFFKYSVFNKRIPLRL